MLIAIALAVTAVLVVVISVRRRLVGYDVFLSYAREDVAYARALETKLTPRLTCFRDETGAVVGDELSKALLRRVRNSTVLVVLVSESSLRSDWVAAELGTYMAVGGKRRPIPIFLKHGLVASLPERFALLRNYLGVLAQGEQPDDVAANAADAIALRFEALRTLTVRRGVAVAVLAVTLGALYAARAQAATAEREQWQQRAESAEREGRYDLAEWYLAKAYEVWWGDRGDVVRAYARVRNARRLTPIGDVALAPRERLVAWGSTGDTPYAVTYRDDSADLFVRDTKSSRLLRHGCRTPAVTTRAARVVWSCGNSLSTIVVGRPETYEEMLPYEPEVLIAVGDEVRLAERGRDGVVIHVRSTADLSKDRATLLKGVESASLVLCNDPEQLAVTVRAEGGFFYVYRWTAREAGSRSYQFYIPDPDGAGAVNNVGLDAVRASSNCGTMFVAYRPWVIETGRMPPGPQWAEITLGAPAPTTALGSNIHALEPVEHDRVVDVLYRTATRNIELLPATTNVVRSVPKTIATGANAFAVWYVPSEAPVFLVADGYLSLYDTQHRIGRYPVPFERVSSVAASTDGQYVVAEGTSGLRIWHKATAATDSRMPASAMVAAELHLDLAAQS